MLKINVHAGHNPKGMVASGAVGLINESEENRKVAKDVIKYFRKFGFTVYNCTVNNGTSQTDVLNKIIKKCNAHKVDYDISIHFNSGANDKRGDGKTTGVEVFIYDEKNKKLNQVAKNICKSISKLGFRNRGVKVNPNLYFLNATKAPAILIECCFVDDADDVRLYNAEKMAAAIVEGVVNCFTFKFRAKKGAYERDKASVNSKKLTKVRYNTVCGIDKIKIINGIIWCHRKKKKTWIKKKWLKKY